MSRNIFIILILSFSIIKCEIGCMDDSKHTNTYDGYDYKTLNYVCCSCPCEKNNYSLIFGKCCRCGHYRTPREFIYLR